MFAKPLATPFCMICLIFLSWSVLVVSEVDMPSKIYIDCEEEIDEVKGNEELMLKPPEQPCDIPQCNPFPCNDGGPPPFCPRNVTICRSGCACIRYCKDTERTIYCYLVKFCRTPRRFSPDVFPTTRMMLY
ncbi:hypothetical protein NE865_09526 [Phthorimaea operculella]|nr:hypothetical protein NE865_09526 [Phthorimaea operculella]